MKITKTLGQQVIENFKPEEKGYECRETVLEYIKSRFGPELEKTIKEHKNFAEKYYIWIVKQDLGHFDAKKINIVVRRSPPTPTYETMLFSYNNKTSELKIEWILPTEELAEAVVKDPADYDEFLIKCVNLYHLSDE